MIEITDVTLRDGLQMVGRVIPQDAKLKLYSKLASIGFDRIEITSFVNPKWVPQFVDSDELASQIQTLGKRDRLMAFVPNEKGIERLLKYNIGWASTFIAASESFNHKNIRQTIPETLQELKKVVTRAHEEARRVRIYLSTAFGCPYEGAVDTRAVIDLFKELVQLGPDEIAISDTIGVATARGVEDLLKAVLKDFPSDRVALHFHNTYGLAIANIQKASEMGIRRFDSSSGGIGGCPYAKGATGNVATEDLMYWFSRREGTSFPREQFVDILSCLKNDLGLMPESSLGSIWIKGGEWYGV